MRNLHYSTCCVCYAVRRTSVVATVACCRGVETVENRIRPSGAVEWKRNRVRSSQSALGVKRDRYGDVERAEKHARARARLPKGFFYWTAVAVQ